MYSNKNRIVLTLHPRSHLGTEHFVKINWLPVTDRVGQITACHVFEISLTLLPHI